MRAVNLLPKDLRTAGAGGGSESPIAAYGMLAVLALAVLLVGAWAYTGRQVKDREAEVATLNAEAQAAETKAAGLADYEAVVQAADKRRTTVVDMVKARFDWADALEDVSRTVTDGYSLTSMKATVSPGVTVDGGATNPLRASVASPAIEVTGCAPSQSGVAVLMSRLRSMKDVTKVVVSSSEKTEGSTAPAPDSAGATSTSDCTAGSNQRPQFNIAIFYGGATASATDAAGGTTTDAAASSTTTTGGAQ